MIQKSSMLGIFLLLSLSTVTALTELDLSTGAGCDTTHKYLCKDDKGNYFIEKGEIPNLDALTGGFELRGKVLIKESGIELDGGKILEQNGAYFYEGSGKTKDGQSFTGKIQLHKGSASIDVSQGTYEGVTLTEAKDVKRVGEIVVGTAGKNNKVGEYSFSDGVKFSYPLKDNKIAILSGDAKGKGMIQLPDGKSFNFGIKPGGELNPDDFTYDPKTKRFETKDNSITVDLNGVRLQGIVTFDTEKNLYSGKGSLFATSNTGSNAKVDLSKGGHVRINEDKTQVELTDGSVEFTTAKGYQYTLNGLSRFENNGPKPTVNLLGTGSSVFDEHAKAGIQFTGKPAKVFLYDIKKLSPEMYKSLRDPNMNSGNMFILSEVAVPDPESIMKQLIAGRPLLEIKPSDTSLFNIFSSKTASGAIIVEDKTGKELVHVMFDNGKMKLPTKDLFPENNDPSSLEENFLENQLKPLGSRDGLPAISITSGQQFSKLYNTDLNEIIKSKSWEYSLAQGVGSLKGTPEFAIRTTAASKYGDLIQEIQKTNIVDPESAQKFYDFIAKNQFLGKNTIATIANQLPGRSGITAESITPQYIQEEGKEILGYIKERIGTDIPAEISVDEIDKVIKNFKSDQDDAVFVEAASLLGSSYAVLGKGIKSEPSMLDSPHLTARQEKQGINSIETSAKKDHGSTKVNTESTPPSIVLATEGVTEVSPKVRVDDVEKTSPEIITKKYIPPKEMRSIADAITEAGYADGSKSTRKALYEATHINPNTGKPVTYTGSSTQNNAWLKEIKEDGIAFGEKKPNNIELKPINPSSLTEVDKTESQQSSPKDIEKPSPFVQRSVKTIQNALTNEKASTEERVKAQSAWDGLVDKLGSDSKAAAALLGGENKLQRDLDRNMGILAFKNNEQYLQRTIFDLGIPLGEGDRKAIAGLKVEEFRSEAKRLQDQIDSGSVKEENIAEQIKFIKQLNMLSKISDSLKQDPSGNSMTAPFALANFEESAEEYGLSQEDSKTLLQNPKLRSDVSKIAWISSIEPVKEVSLKHNNLIAANLGLRTENGKKTAHGVIYAFTDGNGAVKLDNFNSGKATADLTELTNPETEKFFQALGQKGYNGHIDTAQVAYDLMPKGADPRVIQSRLNKVLTKVKEDRLSSDDAFEELDNAVGLRVISVKPDFARKLSEPIAPFVSLQNPTLRSHLLAQAADMLGKPEATGASSNLESTGKGRSPKPVQPKSRSSSIFSADDYDENVFISNFDIDYIGVLTGLRFSTSEDEVTSALGSATARLRRNNYNVDKTMRDLNDNIGTRITPILRASLEETAQREKAQVNNVDR